VIVPDVNLLLYATLNSFDQHAAAKRWWQGALDATETVGLSPLALFGFIRLSTNPRVFREPLRVEEAIAHGESWLARPHVELLHPGPRHLEIAFRLLREVRTGANLATDVQFAALAIESQAELYSNDSDFGRFSGLRWVNPLAKR
jgi:toxin-antitoxin system PIN domain toxin